MAGQGVARQGEESFPDPRLEIVELLESFYISVFWQGVAKRGMAWRCMAWLGKGKEISELVIRVFSDLFRGF